MQRHEVFYLHSNILFQQFTYCSIGFLGLVKNGLQKHRCALQSSLTALQRLEHQAIKS